MFEPRSIAVIGASRSPQKIGAIVLKNIIVSGFRGHIYPINPTITSIGGLKFYPDVAGLPEVADLAVVAIPAGLVVKEIEECGKVGIKNVIIFSAGFKEIGDEGKDLENRLIALAVKYQINILGPNCLGLATTTPPLNVTFSEVTINPGNLRLISQSGALAASLFDWCQSTSVGFDEFVTVGNKAVINENDILRYWQSKLERNNSIGLYLESIGDGRELVKIISQITPHNPVFILKPGKTTASVAVMKSHTGSIAGEDRVFEAGLIKAGAIRCDELGDFVDLAQALAWKSVPTGPGVAVISNAGGPAVLAADTITELGLKVAELSPKTRQRLTGYLPPMASINNPVDILGDASADRFGKVLEIVLEDKAVESVVVILTPQYMTQIRETAKVIGELSQKYSRPIVCSFIGGEDIREGQKILNQYKIPNYLFPEQAINVIAKMWQWERNRTNPPRPTAVSPFEERGIKTDDINKALENRDNDLLLKAIDVPTPPAVFINNVEEAKVFANKNGWPVVMKLIAPEIIHKAEVDGVITGIKTELELDDAFENLKLKHQNLKQGKIQIQKQVGQGIEVIIGVRRDPSFGPVLLFGAGGKYVEVFDDHNLRLLPLSIAEAKVLVGQSKIYKLLSGFRDDPAYELDQLYKIMANLSQLMMEYPQIKEMEINPLIITHEGMWAVDPKAMH